MILKDSVFRAVKNYLDIELVKYTNEPLNQLVALLMSEARFPQHWYSASVSKSSPSTSFSLTSFIWTKFNLHDNHMRWIDETSLNLRSMLMEGHHACDTLRQLIQNSGITVNPDVYAATCINALRCISDLTW